MAVCSMTLRTLMVRCTSTNLIVTSTNPGIRSGDNQSDYFIEHPRRCGSSAKDRPKPTIIGFVVIPQQRKTFLHQARYWVSAKTDLDLRISVHFFRNAGGEP
jgi:hypothetical protein